MLIPLALALSVTTAHPVDSPTLTENPLYKTGKMAKVKCREKPLSSMNRPQARKYIKALNDCLNKAWRAQLKKVGLPLTDADLGFIDKRKNHCGSKWEASVAGMYCHRDFGYVILLDRNLLEYPHTLFIFQLVGHEYGHHIQKTMGLIEAYSYYPTGGKRETQELTRRLELQATCLSGVFLGSAFASLGRPASDVAELRQIIRSSGDEYWKGHDHGRGKNQETWFMRGFESRNPKSCNTWTSKPGKVA
ncbi:neutral zinc metallopeptidase [Herbidospora daliensis]|uniref:neutral zinc metallopeptidase n=1 Tax=Herbidospora daliensis TaxID=295585 RepID=UPI000783D41D|nr:neutral zinc metallopeptidase [Herbidospora daliensis]